MTAKQINDRIETLNQARAEGRITGAEWEGFMEALCQAAQTKKRKGRR